ncbi:MAG TPA: pitrilysin family protein [Gemmatimonadaceae bacterium]
MRPTRFFPVAALLLAGGMAPAALRAQRVDAEHAVPYTRTVLPNGLTLLLNEDHSSPIVALHVWYHVGSKNEVPGKTGFAHLFEHMMSEGSENVAPGEYRLLIRGMGGTMNAETNEDRTEYYEVVPSNQLETVLWMESDRMATLLSRVDQKRLDTEREIVRNERRQVIDGAVFGVANDITSATMFPSDNPYHWAIYGVPADLAAATLDDVRQFFRTYYVPRNAIVALSGDFNPAQARKLVAKYFGSIPAGAAVPRPTISETRLTKETRLALEDARARAPWIRIAWRTAGDDSRDQYALSVLAAVLGRARTGKLSKLLLYDRQLATADTAANFDWEKVGVLFIEVRARPEASLTEIERLVDSVVTDVKQHGPSAADLVPIRQDTAVGRLLQLQSDHEKAHTLAEGAGLTGNPGFYAQRVRGILGVTPADVQRVANTYLGSGRMVLSMVPAGKLNQVSKPELPYVNATPTAAGGKP